MIVAVSGDTTRAARAAARIAAAISVDSGGLVDECVQGVHEVTPEYLTTLESAGENVATVCSYLAGMFLSAIQTEGDLLLYEFWDAMRSMGRRRCAQGLSLDTLLEVAAIHRQCVMRAVERAVAEESGPEQIVLVAQRRADAAMEKHTLSLTRGYLDGMQERYQEQQAVLSALIAVAGAMNRSLEVREVAETGLNEVLKATGMQVSCLWIPGTTGKELILSYSAGLTWEEDRALRETPSRVGGSDIVGSAAAFDGPVHGRFRGGQLGLRGDWSAVAVALRLKDSLTGVLSVATRQRRQFSSNELAFFTAIADHLAVALDRAYQHRRDARTDLLTGIANRAEFERAMQREVAAAERHEHPLSLMLLDLDDLKSINDRYGHQVGDEAIREVADALRKVVRASDTCARLGGDEFAIAMPQAEERQAYEVAFRIRESLAVHGVGRLPTPLSVSFGVAGWEAGLDPSRMFQLADARLYRDKRRKHIRRRRPATGPADQASLFKAEG